MNRSEIMKTAWNAYRSYNFKKFNRDVFADCLKLAWNVTLRPRIYVYDTRGEVGRGHMYQAI